MLSLRELQRRFFEALGPGPADGALLALVRPHGALAPAQRLGIYAGMYRTRLVDVLREDFPRVLAILGDAEFTALAGRYVTRHPSTDPSVRHVGRAFAEHLAAEAPPLAFLPDLARLEWARVEVFDAPDPAPLRLADLAGIAPADWPALRFRPIEACRVVESAWPVHEAWAAAGGAEPAGPLRPAPTVVRVWREGWSVSHAAMSPGEIPAFRALGRGEPFAEICAEAGAGRGEPEAAAREAGALLLRWLEDGLLQWR
jgi:hypothetical protein